MVLPADALEPQQGMLVGCIPTLQTPPSPPSPSDASQRQMTADASLCRVLRPENTASSPLQMADNDYKRANPEEAMAFYDVALSPPPNASMPSTRCLTAFLQGRWTLCSTARGPVSSPTTYCCAHSRAPTNRSSFRNMREWTPPDCNSSSMPRQTSCLRSSL